MYCNSKWRRKESVIPYVAKPVAADVYAGGCPEGQISIVFGIVEYEDGSVDEVRPAQIRFVDNKIKGYAFEEG